MISNYWRDELVAHLVTKKPENLAAAVDDFFKDKTAVIVTCDDVRDLRPDFCDADCRHVLNLLGARCDGVNRLERELQHVIENPEEA